MDGTSMGTQIAREINATFVTNDTCVVVFAVAFVDVAGGMITTAMIASDLAIEIGTLLRVQDAAARVARVDMTSDEMCGHTAHPAVLQMTGTLVISLNYPRRLPAHMARTSLDGISGRHLLRLPDQRRSKTHRH